MSEVTQEELEEACRDANILDFIKSLPEYARTSFLYFWPLNLLAAALKQMLVARVHNYPVVRNVGFASPLTYVLVLMIKIRAHCDCTGTSPQSEGPLT